MIKVKRGEETLEIDEKDKQDGDELITETPQSKTEEKKFTQTELNALIAKEKRDAQKKYETLSNDFASYKTDIETKQKAEEAKLKGKVENLRKGVDPSIIKLLDKLTLAEQVEYLEDPENQIDKVKIPETPKGKGDIHKPEKPIGTII